MWLDAAILLRLIAAGLLAGIIGWERENAGKEAGLRTHIFVGMGAALFVALGVPVLLDFRGYGSQVGFDPLRLIEAVVAAMGFIGAGTIFVAQNRVQGLTTAASLWLTAAIGITVALEHYLLAVGTTLLALGILRGLLFVEARLAVHRAARARARRKLPARRRVGPVARPTRRSRATGAVRTVGASD